MNVLSWKNWFYQTQRVLRLVRAHWSNARNSTHIRILIFARISEISRTSLVNSFYIFSLLKIKKFHFKCKNIFKFKIWFSNEIDFGFQFRIPLSEIIWIVCLNVCDLEKVLAKFHPMKSVGIANNLSSSLAQIFSTKFFTLFSDNLEK